MSKATRLARAKGFSSEEDALQAQPSPHQSPAPTADPKYRAVYYDELVRDLRTLATRDDGWLRLIPDTNRQQVHLKWKFTRGKWDRHYVWVTAGDMRVHYAIQILLRKIYEVDTEERVPTLDKLYGED